jgi:DNA polymerase sigma
VKEYI